MFVEQQEREREKRRVFFFDWINKLSVLPHRIESAGDSLKIIQCFVMCMQNQSIIISIAKKVFLCIIFFFNFVCDNLHILFIAFSPFNSFPKVCISFVLLLIRLSRANNQNNRRHSNRSACHFERVPVNENRLDQQSAFNAFYKLSWTDVRRK